ncbi:uncharacterized protein PHALS_01940 [Plasmopara halstedii]|uniref:Uncharacterized protein n=1 Tax=Plasmopara halstedii TaxID=4781 RepID=A0A0P1ATJ0_PLAHL|nr:uncharacterized protein PHALS_01940 [Plasmopara halstedii]CEG45657.1 hypothetical protein PHALS_01940 [Plasmopara halstedii]|eukprot:XP_024582026.1 hypothetical protein PHALS_01940 [Plasmopara halstedii]
MNVPALPLDDSSYHNWCSSPREMTNPLRGKRLATEGSSSAAQLDEQEGVHFFI